MSYFFDRPILFLNHMKRWKGNGGVWSYDQRIGIQLHQLQKLQIQLPLEIRFKPQLTRINHLHFWHMNIDSSEIVGERVSHEDTTEIQQQPQLLVRVFE